MSATQTLLTAAGDRANLFVLSGGPVRFAGTASGCAPDRDRVCLAERHPDTACALFGCELEDGTALSIPKGATLPAIDLDA